MHRRATYFDEKQVIMVLTEVDQADAVFEFLYHECGIHERHAGMVFMETVSRAEFMVAPEGEWEES